MTKTQSDWQYFFHVLYLADNVIQGENYWDKHEDERAMLMTSLFWCDTIGGHIILYIYIYIINI